MTNTKPAPTAPTYKTTYVVSTNGMFFTFDDEFKADAFAENNGAAVVPVETRVQ